MSEGRTGPGRAAGTPRLTPGLVTYIAGLGVGAAAVAIAAAGTTPPGRAVWTMLPLLGLLMIAAEHLTVRFRYGGEVDAINLVEAVLAPLLFAFPGEAVVLTVAVAHTLAAFPRRNAPVKVAFNVAQWALAAGIGACVLDAAASGEGVTVRNIAALLAALLAVLVTNQVAFTFVVAIAGGHRPGEMLRAFGPVIAAGWIGGWLVNVLIGVLYAVAYAGHPLSVVLFAVPLVVLNLAYRGYAAARSDRLRLAGLHRAAQVLAAPLDPRDAIDPFLREVVLSFEASAAELVLRVEGGREVHRSTEGGTGEIVIEPEDVASIEGALSAHPGPVRITAGRDALARVLADRGWRECLAAPLFDDGRLMGALLVFDQAGIETAPEAALAVLDALARETASAFAKGRLLASVLEERRKLAEIVSTTSDGLLTLAADGTVRSWNPALEQITGLRAADVLGRADALLRLQPRTVAGFPVDLASWADGTPLPAEVRITTAGGQARRLSCSYSQAVDEGGAARTLVVVARDVTPAEEIEALRAQFSRVVEQEAAQRLVVEHLQQTVMPARPDVAGADLAVAYLASDPTAPTGGDLYDWQVLPDGAIHVAVVDVLGHGVAATKDALAVVHALRVVAVDGTPLEDVVERADQLLGAQNPELVATVVVARYDPATGILRVVAGGHPPALVVTREGEVTQVPASGGAIGWPGAGSDLVAEVRLGVGDALVLYTDGLVEARKNILDGMDTLVRHAREAAHLTAEALADALLERALAGAARRDDSLVLVLRRTPVAAPERSRVWRTAPRLEDVSAVRRELAAWLAANGVEPGDAALVAAELLANGAAAARSQIVARVELEQEAVVVEVTDDGAGHPELGSAGQQLPAADAEVGRGLYIVRALCHDLSILSTPEGSVVRALLPRVTAREPAEEPGRAPGARFEPGRS